MIHSALDENSFAIWKIGEQTALYDDMDPYIAVSHVWLDGTGVGAQAAGKVNPCLFNYFADIAAKLGCGGIWWDTISIPVDRKARGKALNRMQESFKWARWTVVHDEFLVQFPWSDDGLPCIAVILSNWFSRGWTALELAFSSHVKIIFKDGKTGSRVLKDLDTDILAPRQRPILGISLENWAAITIIRQLRDRSAPRTSGWGFLHPLALRTTSWERDRSVIAALMAGVKSLKPHMTQAEVTRKTVTKLGWLPSSFLFHGFPTMTDQGRFSWCPHTLFNGQKLMGSRSGAPSHDARQKIGKRGEIEGFWRASILTEEIANDIKPRSSHFSVDLRIKLALQQWQNCLLIDLHFASEGHVLDHNRIFDRDRLCILVVVRDCKDFSSDGRPILDCQYIGCVYEPSKLGRHYVIVIRFGKTVGQSGVNAVQMLRTYETLSHEDRGIRESRYQTH